MASILLDISRSISRAPFSYATGIDRVEQAYIQHFINSEGSVWFLSRVLKGYALLDRNAMKIVWPMILRQAPWQKIDMIARLFSHKLPEPVNRAESTLRRVARATCLRPGLARMLRNNLPKGFTYLNIGHSNRKPALWQAINQGGAGQKLAMVHDVIPLDFPHFTRADTALRFEKELKATAQACDALIYNSADTACKAAKWLDKWGLYPDNLPILLGVDPLAAPNPVPASEPPEFVILGTIEPRKNHRMLLDIWADIPAELHIIGQRGWRNEDVFATLDEIPMIGKTVFEHSDLSDPALAARLARARALLFPSFAEGFGYPLIEALQMGIPVICSDLPCFREIAGDFPTYLPAHDSDAWKAAILSASNAPREAVPKDMKFPTWEQHFAKLDMFLYRWRNQTD